MRWYVEFDLLHMSLYIIHKENAQQLIRPRKKKKCDRPFFKHLRSEGERVEGRRGKNGGDNSNKMLSYRTETARQLCMST